MNLDEKDFHKSSCQRGRAFYCKNCRKKEWKDKKEQLSRLLHNAKCEMCNKYAQLYDKNCKKCLKILGLRPCKKCLKIKLKIEFYQRSRICKKCVI